jgi:hypothetical protein
MLTKSKETSESTAETMDFINNGTLSMLMSGRVNQRRER